MYFRLKMHLIFTKHKHFMSDFEVCILLLESEKRVNK